MSCSCTADVKFLFKYMPEFIIKHGVSYSYDQASDFINTKPGSLDYMLIKYGTFKVHSKYYILLAIVLSSTFLLNFANCGQSYYSFFFSFSRFCNTDINQIYNCLASYQTPPLASLAEVNVVKYILLYNIF